MAKDMTTNANRNPSVIVTDNTGFAAIATALASKLIPLGTLILNTSDGSVLVVSAEPSTGAFVLVGAGTDFSGVSDADMSADFGKFVKFTSAGKFTLAGDGEPAVGVVLNVPEAGADQAVVVRRSGYASVKLASNRTALDYLTSSATGTAELALETVVDAAGPALKGSYVNAQLLQSGTTGQLKLAFIGPIGLIPATFTTT
jgi:hypothetical protein